MAELADALDSGSSRSNSVEVQVLLPAPKQKGTQSRSLLFWCGSGRADTAHKAVTQGVVLPRAVEVKSALGAQRQGVCHAPQMAPDWVPFVLVRQRTRRHCAQGSNARRSFTPRGGGQVRTWCAAPRCLPRTEKACMDKQKAPEDRVLFVLNYFSAYMAAPTAPLCGP